MDIQLKLSKTNDILTLTVEKNKDAKPAKDLIFNLTEHEITGWKEENGNPVTSCTIELAEKLMQFRNEQLEQEKEKEEREKTEKKKPKLTTNQKYLFEAYEKAAKEYGFIVCDNEATKHEVIYVKTEKWKEIFCYIKSGDNEKSKKCIFYNTLGALPQTLKVLEIKRDKGIEYHCLDMSGNADPSYKIAIRAGIKERERREAENKKAAEAMEADTTGNLFKD